MKEYTILALFSVFLPLVVGYFLKTHIFKKPAFYVTLFIMFFAMFFVNGYLTAFPIISYNPSMILGFKLGTIPVEDFLFGFSMMVLTLVLWESFKRGSFEN